MAKKSAVVKTQVKATRKDDDFFTLTTPVFVGTEENVGVDERGSLMAMTLKAHPTNFPADLEAVDVRLEIDLSKLPERVTIGGENSTSAERAGKAINAWYNLFPSDQSAMLRGAEQEVRIRIKTGFFAALEIGETLASASNEEILNNTKLISAAPNPSVELAVRVMCGLRLIDPSASTLTEDTNEKIAFAIVD